MKYAAVCAALLMTSRLGRAWEESEWSAAWPRSAVSRYRNEANAETSPRRDKLATARSDCVKAAMRGRGNSFTRCFLGISCRRRPDQAVRLRAAQLVLDSTLQQSTANNFSRIRRRNCVPRNCAKKLCEETVCEWRWPPSRLLRTSADDCSVASTACPAGARERTRRHEKKELTRPIS